MGYLLELFVGGCRLKINMKTADNDHQQMSSGPLAQEVTAGAEMDFVNILLHNFLSSQLKW